jgi:hypothetical protein
MRALFSIALGVGAAAGMLASSRNGGDPVDAAADADE